MKQVLLRHIGKQQQLYTFKVVSLSIAFACAILVVSFALFEFGYDDTFNEGTFRILFKNTIDDYNRNRLSVKVPLPVYKKIETRKPALTFARVKVMNGITIIADNSIHADQKVHTIDANKASILLTELSDNEVSLFTGDSRNILISSHAANELFDSGNVEGRKLKLTAEGDTLTFTVSKVFRSLPANTHDVFDFVIPFNENNIRSLNFNPADFGVYGFEGSQPSSSYNEITTLISEGQYDVILQPISQIYFGPRVLGEEAAHGDAYSIFLLLIVTITISLLSTCTFINLASLTLPARAREIAMKKIFGKTPRNLLFYFAGEFLSISMISLFGGLIILTVFQGIILTRTGIDVPALMVLNWRMTASVVLILILLLTTSPLFITWRYLTIAPSRLLGNESVTFPSFKKRIMVVQLGTSIFLIIISIVIGRQIDYSLVKEPGRNNDQIVYLNYPDWMTLDEVNYLSENWKKLNPHIIDVMASSQLPGHVQSKELETGYFMISVNPSFKDFFGYQMVSGNWFRPNDPQSTFIATQTAALTIPDSTSGFKGVIEDLSSLQNRPERPTKIYCKSSLKYNFLCIRIIEVDIRKTVSFLARYFQLTDNHSINYLDLHFQYWIAYQDRLNALSQILTLISVILSCVAIYSLTINVVRDKTKKIALHQLFGANVGTVSLVLINEFSRPLLYAGLIFIPASFITLGELLRIFVYRTPITYEDILAPATYALVITGIICFVQALILQRNNLIGSLKS